MIHLLFFLKFKSQLRRTRPDIVRQIDESILNAIKNAGGKITGHRMAIFAEFNEERIGFWLDMYILIESLKKNMESNTEVFGYSLVIGDKLPNAPEKLCGFLANHNGVFMNEKITRNFIPYATFEKPSEWLNEKENRKYGCGSYYRIRELKDLEQPAKDEPEPPCDLFNVFEQEPEKNTLIIEQPYSGTRTDIYNYCKKLNGDFPPLSVCFGSTGIGALVDIWSLNIRSLTAGELYVSNGNSGAKPAEEIDSLREFLFRERIRDEVSEYVIRCVIRFLHLVIDFYINAALKRKCTPVLVLENIHLAGNTLVEILFNTYDGIDTENKKRLLILGTGENDISPERLTQWETVFHKTTTVSKNQNQIVYPKLSVELWEIVYAISLFARYFSPELFYRLFEENDLNPAMISRAFSILHSLGIIDNSREPRLTNRCYEENAARVLGEKCEKIKKLVCRLVLSWTEKQSINPCFRLLTIISGLDNSKQIDDLLLLQSFSSDIINKTVTGIETAIKSGQFEEMVSVKASAIRYIFYTSKALHTGNEKDIEDAFDSSFTEDINVFCDSYPVLKAQIFINLCACNLGRHNSEEAMQKAKEAILLGQNNNIFCLLQAYRMFALVCLSKQQITETIEYLGFALSNAGKAGNYHEAGISAYYAAAAYFLYGDIFNAAKHARKAIKQLLNAGSDEWADRALFLEGRVEFELGHYSQAMEIFETLLKEPFGKYTEEKDSLFAAWIYRCKIYMRKPGITKPIRSGNDTNLFEIEEAYLSGNFKRAMELSNSIENPFLNETFFFTEQVDWRSGFAQCEQLFFTHGEIQERLKCVFHSLALSAIQEETSEDPVKKIQQIIRDEKLCEMDPWDAFYFYAKYRVLENTGADIVDMSTTVSMAFKRLQRRAGRIEDIETRRQYLNGPRWNSELSLAAKEFKLI